MSDTHICVYAVCVSKERRRERRGAQKRAPKPHVSFPSSSALPCSACRAHKHTQAHTHRHTHTHTYNLFSLVMHMHTHTQDRALLFPHLCVGGVCVCCGGACCLCCGLRHRCALYKRKRGREGGKERASLRRICVSAVDQWLTEGNDRTSSLLSSLSLSPTPLWQEKGLDDGILTSLRISRECKPEAQRRRGSLDNYDRFSLS